MGRKRAFALALLMVMAFSIELAYGKTAPYNADGHLSAVRISPNPVVAGHTAILEIDQPFLAQSASDIRVDFRDTIIPLSEHPSDKRKRIGLIGVSYHSKPGTDTVNLAWSDTAGRHSYHLPLEVVGGQFKSERIKVTPSRVTPSREDLERIQRERAEVESAYALSRQHRIWNLSFEKPTIGKITSPFGTRRVLNGKLKSFHNGVDFRAAVGTPVHATNAGIVRLAKNLFFSGNVVILDHGNRLFSIYAHLSRFSVSPGQFVDKGQEIGQAGATGRVSGPHLHWGVKVNGISVNPLDLIDLLNDLVDRRQASQISDPQTPAVY